MKYEIVERLALALNEEKPEEPQLFDGTKALPKSPKDIGRLNLSYLQSVLKYHGLAQCGTKMNWYYVSASFPTIEGICASTGKGRCS